MNANTEETIKKLPHMSTVKDKEMSHEIPGRLLESLGADIFTINNKHYLCIAYYPTKFPVIKQVEGFSANNPIKACNIIFSEYGLHSTIALDAGTHFTSKKFEKSCERPGIWHAVSSLYNHQSKGQTEACIKICQKNHEKCYESNVHTYMSLLQVRSTSICLRLLIQLCSC